MRTDPRYTGQRPTSARTSEDLPEALGPITPSALPAFRVKLTPWIISCDLPGGPLETASTASSLEGAGRASGETASGRRASVCRSLFQDCCAATNPFQLAIACST